MKELMGPAQSGWRFEHCRELAAHFAWIWGKDAGGEEEEIWERLLELNRYFYMKIIAFKITVVNRNYSVQQKSTEKATNIPMNGSALTWDWMDRGGVFQRTAFAEIQGSGRQDPLT